MTDPDGSLLRQLSVIVVVRDGLFSVNDFVRTAAFGDVRTLHSGRDRGEHSLCALAVIESDTQVFECVNLPCREFPTKPDGV